MAKETLYDILNNESIVKAYAFDRTREKGELYIFLDYDKFFERNIQVHYLGIAKNTTAKIRSFDDEWIGRYLQIIDSYHDTNIYSLNWHIKIKLTKFDKDHSLIIKTDNEIYLEIKEKIINILELLNEEIVQDKQNLRESIIDKKTKEENIKKFAKEQELLQIRKDKHYKKLLKENKEIMEKYSVIEKDSDITKTIKKFKKTGKIEISGIIEGGK